MAVVGDPLYNPEKALCLMLHAHRLRHPPHIEIQELGNFFRVLKKD